MDEWMDGWVDGWMDKQHGGGSMHTVEYYAAVKRSETWTVAKTWMDLEHTRLSERSRHRALSGRFHFQETTSRPPSRGRILFPCTRLSSWKAPRISPSALGRLCPLAGRHICPLLSRAPLLSRLLPVPSLTCKPTLEASLHRSL